VEEDGERAVRQAKARARPVPVLAGFGEERGGDARAVPPPDEIHRSDTRIGPGLQRDGVAGKGRLAPRVGRDGIDEAVAEEPEKTPAAEIDRDRRVAAQPARIGMEEALGLAPGARQRRRMGAGGEPGERRRRDAAIDYFG